MLKEGSLVKLKTTWVELMKISCAYHNIPCPDPDAIYTILDLTPNKNATGGGSILLVEIGSAVWYTYLAWDEVQSPEEGKLIFVELQHSKIAEVA